MKQYFTGFLTAVCLTASVFIFMGFQNKNLGDITVNSIKVIGQFGFPEGETAMFISGDFGGHLTTYNAYGV